jgi:hypothetical membrane protein
MAISQRRLAAAGIAAPVLFTTLVLLQELLQPSYDRVSTQISALAAWPLGWIQNLDFIVFAWLLFAFVIGLDRGVAGAPGGRAGIGLLVLAAFGAFLAGAFPWTTSNGKPIATSEHIMAAITHFLAAAFGLVVLSRRLALDPRWKDLWPFTLLGGLAMLGLFTTHALFAVGPSRPLHPWAGLLQRLTVLIWFGCLLALAFRLRRLASAEAPAGRV